MSVCTNVTDGRQVQLFQFSFSSVAYGLSSVGPEPKKKRYGQTQTNKQTDTIKSGNTLMAKNLLLNLFNSKKIKRDRWHNSRTNNAVLLTLRSISQSNAMFGSNAMQPQCNTMQCNAQYNAMHAMSSTIQVIQCTVQCNAMYVRIRPSVRNEVSQSFFFFYF
jgi:hypothetical protein